jgi:hypothetical protein
MLILMIITLVPVVVWAKAKAWFTGRQAEPGPEDGPRDEESW